MTGTGTGLRHAWPALRWGERTVTVLSDGLIRLDGGAMFGVVPRILWEKKMPPDDRNRITMAMNCLLVEGPEGKTVIETGTGPKEDARFLAMYGIEQEGGLAARLTQAGTPPESVDHVVLTHLHFDHAGGATKWSDEEAVAAFPNARYYMHGGEYADATSPGERGSASYFDRNYVPLAEAGVVSWIGDGDRPLPGIEIMETPGHTRHHVSVLVDDGSGRKIIFLGDLVPTTAHLPWPWVMAYDLFPVTTIETKKRVLGRAHEEEWLCAFVHDAERPLAYLAADAKGRLRVDGERDPWSA